MVGYLSSKAKVGGVLFEGSYAVLGGTFIGRGSLIGDACIIGYPIRASVKSLMKLNNLSLDDYDSVSGGSYIGVNAILRSNSIIYESVKIGDNFECGHGILIREKSVIGDNVRIGTGSIIDGDVSIGDDVNIQSSVYIPPRCIIESGVFIAPRVCFTNDRYPPSRRLLGVTVKRNAVLGANSTFISGVTVGEGAVVAAGAVVTRDVPPHVVVAGVPAKIISTTSNFNKKKRLWESVER